MAQKILEHPIYRPLDPEKREVRFMRILSTDGGNTSTTIHCEVQTFSLDQRPDYKALSYAWTKEQPTCQIRVNGRPFPVRPNLYEYLRIVHAESQSGWIFIDAICINQDDLAERSAQVRLMGSIYREAEEVIAWLGQEGPVYRNMPVKVRRRCEEGFDRATTQGTNPLSEMDNRTQQCFVISSCRSQYWTRLWITQELFLARKLTFRNVRFLLDWRYLLQWLEKNLESGTGIYIGGYTLELPRAHAKQLSSRCQTLDAERSRSVAVVHEARKAVRNRENMHTQDHNMLLSTAVAVFTVQECTEWQDKIFGLLGLARSVLEADYRMKIHELYLRVYVESFLELGNSQKESDDRLHFDNVLLTALKLEPEGPFIALITCRAREKLSGVFENWPSEDFKLSTYRRFWSSGSTLKRKIKSSSFAVQRKLRSIDRQLKRLQEKDGLISSPNRSETKRYSEWLAWCDVIIDDVLRLVHAKRGFTFPEEVISKIPARE